MRLVDDVSVTNPITIAKAHSTFKETCRNISKSRLDQARRIQESVQRRQQRRREERREVKGERGGGE